MVVKVSCCLQLGERIHGSLDTTDSPTDVCPRRIHAGSSCSCRFGLSAEESGSRAISRMVFLSQTWFEVIFCARLFELYIYIYVCIVMVHYVHFLGA